MFHMKVISDYWTMYIERNFVFILNHLGHLCLQLHDLAFKDYPWKRLENYCWLITCIMPVSDCTPKSRAPWNDWLHCLLIANYLIFFFRQEWNPCSKTRPKWRRDCRHCHFSCSCDTAGLLYSFVSIIQ